MSTLNSSKNVKSLTVCKKEFKFTFLAIFYMILSLPLPQKVTKCNKNNLLFHGYKCGIHFFVFGWIAFFINPKTQNAVNWKYWPNSNFKISWKLALENLKNLDIFMGSNIFFIFSWKICFFHKKSKKTKVVPQTLNNNYSGCCF